VTKKKAHTAILGVGYALPESVRRNDDPIFDWLRQNDPAGKDLFTGYDERRFLAPGEDVTDIAVAAARRALEDAEIAAGKVDLIIGYVSVSEYLNPNALAKVHHRLGLNARALVLPLNNEFNNFNSGLWVATALIAQGMAHRALVVCAGDWTRRVDYHTPQAISAGDGAGAAVIGQTTDASRFVVRDSEVVVESDAYGSMYMRGQPVQSDASCEDVPQDCTYTSPFFQITDAGRDYFRKFGGKKPPEAAIRLLARNKLRGGDIALISHQASSVLMNAWAKAIDPGHYVNTISKFANMTVATIPVNFALAHETIVHDNVVLLGIGVEMQTQAILLTRSS
jgi:3-oxoacyl-[acyl-carrier-protein] synthase-3